MTDAQFALLFDSDGSVMRGFGALVDNIQVHGRDVFVAMGPSNLSATNFGDDVVNLSWSAPGTGGSVDISLLISTMFLKLRHRRWKIRDSTQTLNHILKRLK